MGQPQGPGGRARHARLGVLRQRLGGEERVRERERARAETRVDGVLERDALAGREALLRARQRRELARRQRPAVVTHAVGVGVHGLRAARARQRHLGRAPVDERARLAPRAVGAEDARAQRQAPALAALALAADRQETRDLDVEDGGARAVDGRLHVGDARLVEEGGEGRGDVALGVARQRPQEVGGRGVAMAVLGQVRAHALLEGRGAEPVLEHADDGGALGVGDAVEGVDDVALAEHGLADLPRAHQAVLAAHPVGARARLRLRVEVGAHGVHRQVLHPRGEGLVEPQVVPPRHGDEVAEPLVREFVRDDVGVALLLPDGRAVVDVEVAVAEGDEARVLHGARAEVGHRHDVELVVGVRDAEPLLEPREHARRRCERGGELGAVAARSDAAHGQRAIAQRVLRQHGTVDDVEGPHGERQQVHGQRLRDAELEGGAARRRRAPLEGRVAHGDVRRRRGDAHGERRLDGGLVEARHRLAHVDGLELREHVGRAGELDLVHALEVVLERRTPGEHHVDVAGAGGARQRHLGQAVVVDLGPRAGLSAHRRRDVREPAAVQPEGALRARQVHAPHGATRERRGGGVDVEGKHPRQRPHVGGQAQGGRGLVGRRGR